MPRAQSRFACISIDEPLASGGATGSLRTLHFRDGIGAQTVQTVVHPACTTSSDGYINLRHVSRKTQITLSDRQYAFLVDEAERTGLSMAELVRRCIDAVYRPFTRPRIRGFELSVALAHRPDAALVGRRYNRRRKGGRRPRLEPD